MATRAEREQEEADREKAEKQQRDQQQRQGHATGQPGAQAQDAVNAEQRRVADEAAKQQKAYLDEMNRKLGDFVNTAASMKDKDPQLLNYTVEALKRAAMQLEGATPPNLNLQGQPQPRNL